MEYSFTSPEVAGALISAKRRGVDVRGGDWTGKPIPGKTITPAG
ncbi:putative phospholipase D (plasmid) [Salmonella enterica subsp. enterica serovar Typhimurium]|nr:putative phospholipase D [Salmonella enterica subsp. enterica serovar Typhimurium]